MEDMAVHQAHPRDSVVSLFHILSHFEGGRYGLGRLPKIPLSCGYLSHTSDPPSCVQLQICMAALSVPEPLFLPLALPGLHAILLPLALREARPVTLSGSRPFGRTPHCDPATAWTGLL